MSLAKFINRLRKDLWHEELADAIWLASLNFFELTREHSPAEGDAVADDADDADRLEENEEDEAKAGNPPEPVAAAPRSTEGSEDRRDGPSAEVTLPEPHPLRSGSRGGIPIRAPSGRALPGSRAIARSLRPLRRLIASRIDRVIDEEASATHIAELDIWFPTLRPARSRWLEIALVIDESPSMSIWRDTLRELRSIFAQLGAFRDVRIWWLDTSSPQHPRLRARPNGVGSAGRAPGELLSSDGNRLVLIASDCVAAAWDGAEVARLATLWGARQPVAILQLLPQELWSRTALDDARGVQYVLAGSSQPGAANTQLDWRAWRPRTRRPSDAAASATDARSGMSFPVLVSEPESLGSWARLIRFGSSMTVPAVRFPATPLEVIPIAVSTAAPSVNPKDALIHFRSVSSELAFRLATLFAAARLQLPVMRLVQSSLLPGSRQVHLAEFFLSGLIQRKSAAQRTDPDEVEYEFLSGVRGLLLDESFALDTVEVQRAVSRYMGERIGRTLDFDAILKDPDGFGGVEIDAEMAPFARISAQVLKRLGGRYAAVAARLAGEAAAASVSSPPSVDRGDRPLLGTHILWVGPEGADIATRHIEKADLTPVNAEMESDMTRLTILGATLVVATDPPSALERASKEAFDAIISAGQIGTGRFAGIQLLDSLQSQGNFTPLAIYTSNPFETAVQATNRHAIACSHDFNEILAALMTKLRNRPRGRWAPPPHLPQECMVGLRAYLEGFGRPLREEEMGLDIGTDGDVPGLWRERWAQLRSVGAAGLIKVAESLFEAASRIDCRISKWETLVESADVESWLTRRARRRFEVALGDVGIASAPNIPRLRNRKAFSTQQRSWYAISIGPFRGPQSWVVMLDSPLPYVLGTRHLEWLRMLAGSLADEIDHIETPPLTLTVQGSIATRLEHVGYPLQISVLLRMALRLEGMAWQQNDPLQVALLWECRDRLQVAETALYAQEYLRTPPFEWPRGSDPTQNRPASGLVECTQYFANMVYENACFQLYSFRSVPDETLRACASSLDRLTREHRQRLMRSLEDDLGHSVNPNYPNPTEALLDLGPLWQAASDEPPALPMARKPIRLVLVCGTTNGVGFKVGVPRLLGRALAAAGFGLITSGLAGVEAEVTGAFLERLAVWGFDREQWLVEIPEVGTPAGRHPSGTVLQAKSDLEALTLRFERASAVVLIGDGGRSGPMAEMSRETDTPLISLSLNADEAGPSHDSTSASTGGPSQVGEPDRVPFDEHPFRKIARLPALLRIERAPPVSDAEYGDPTPGRPFNRNFVLLEVRGRVDRILVGSILARPRVIVARVPVGGPLLRLGFFDLWDFDGRRYVSRELFRHSDQTGTTLVLEVPPTLEAAGLRCDSRIPRGEESLWVAAMSESVGRSEWDRPTGIITLRVSAHDPSTNRVLLLVPDPDTHTGILQKQETPVFDAAQHLYGFSTLDPTDPSPRRMVPVSDWYRSVLVHHAALKVRGSLTEPPARIELALHEPTRPRTVPTPTSFRSQLCSKLEQRLADADVEWAYHPRSGLGKLINECLIDVMKQNSGELVRAVNDGALVLAENAVVRSQQRDRRINLTVEHTRTHRILAAVEAKVCMTEHAKARPRLVAEVTSGIDFILQGLSETQVFCVVVVNFSDAYTSPTNFPGPTVHSTLAAPRLFDALSESLSRIPGLAGLLLVPITFDNSALCTAAPDPKGDYLAVEAEFMAKLTRAALQTGT